MAKQYKIKRGRKHHGAYKARPHPLTIILSIAAIVALVFVGISVYEPVYNFVMSLGERVDPQLPQEESLPEEQPTEPQSAATEAPTEPPAVPVAVDGIHAAWMPLEAAANIETVEAFLDTLPAGINAVLLDVKDSQGMLHYRTANKNALQWEAMGANPVDISFLSEALEARDFHLVTRMHTFSDAVAARGDRANAVKYQNTETLWLDNYADRGGKPWANPYASSMRGYLVELAVELGQQGAAMVVLDGIRFPDDMTGTASFGNEAKNTSRGDILKAFVDQVEQALEPLAVRTAVHFSATAVGHASRETRYGGNPLAMAGSGAAMISILPGELGDGVLAAGVTVARPATDLTATVSDVLTYVSEQAPEGLRIIPLLTGRNTADDALNKSQVDAQLAVASQKAGKEYVLYAADGAYSK